MDGDAVVAINPSTGQSNFSVQMDHSTSTGDRVSNTPPVVGNLIVAGDGYAYVPYQYSQTTGTSSQNVSSSSSTQFLNVLWVGSGGDSTKLQVKQWSNQSSSSTFLDGAQVPNGWGYCNDACIAYFNTFTPPWNCD